MALVILPVKFIFLSSLPFRPYSQAGRVGALRKGFKFLVSSEVVKIGRN